MFALGIILAVLVGLGLANALVRDFRLRVNARAFMAQIDKLVLSNNIDRAIKLANAAPRAVLPQVIKTMLVRSNRSHELHLTFEEALFALTTHDKRTRMARTAALVALFTLASFWAFAALSDFPSFIGAAIGGGSALGAAAWWVSDFRFTSHLDEAKLHLLHLRNLLYARASSYSREESLAPASHLPRPEGSLSAEELASWKAAMEEFNRMYAEGKKHDPRPPHPQKAHDKKADGQGLLPSL